MWRDVFVFLFVLNFLQSRRVGDMMVTILQMRRRRFRDVSPPLRGAELGLRQPGVRVRKPILLTTQSSSDDFKGFWSFSLSPYCLTHEEPRMLK